VGDVDGTGRMRYVEYTCDTGTGRLYRNEMAWNEATKPTPGVEQVLLDNVMPNPDGTDCFTYEVKEIDEDTDCVIGVAITLTVRTQDRDPITGDFQTETKALLNVAPRNVFNTWQVGSLGIPGRVQPLPAEVVNLLPPVIAEQAGE
jgi:hypothetical protein